jgi:phosphinothricin acetyltransferase
VEIRPARADDLPVLVEIDNHHIAHGHATFDEEPFTVAERQPWFAQFALDGRHRLLVATDAEDRPVGYAGTSAYREHRSFEATVVTSIYLAPGHLGQGIGTQLYERLFAELGDEDLRVVLAGIALPNEASVALHHRFGFVDVGVFEGYALKHGRPMSSLWLQRNQPRR